MSIWLPAGLAAAALIHIGLARDGWAFILSGFAAILAGFVGHLLVNVTHQAGFSPRELGLGLVLYVVALVAFGLAVLLEPGFSTRAGVPMAIGFLSLFAAVVFTMLTTAGTRGAFSAFDVIKSFRLPERPPTRRRADPR